MNEIIKNFKKEYMKTKIDTDPVRVEKQHKKNKLTASERIELLLDKNTFVEMFPFAVHRCTDFGMEKKQIYGDGIIVGAGKINGKLVYVASQDFTAIGGSMSEQQSIKYAKVFEMALQTGTPFIQINDSGGARIHEGIQSLEGYGRIFQLNTKASGIIPQYSVILGPCAGGAVYSPAITDFVFLVDKLSKMFITGPAVIKQVTYEEVNPEYLGGAITHNQISGNAHFYCATERKCFEDIRTLITLLPSNNMEINLSTTTNDNPSRKVPELNKIIPDNPKTSYDIRDIIFPILDDNVFIEVHKYFARNAVVGFGKLNGKTVGIVANQPKVLAGTLDINSSDKIARFVRFCDSFNIPLINLVDVPGFLPGVDQEHSGIIRHGAKILYAYSEATVPKISLIVRKAFGGAYVALCSPAMGYDRTLAWPTAEIAVMGAEGAAAIIHKREIKASENPDETRQQKIEEYREHFSNPISSAKLNIIDNIIEPAKTRIELINSLEMLEKKKVNRPFKKHGNIPL